MLSQLVNQNNLLNFSNGQLNDKIIEQKKVVDNVFTRTEYDVSSSPEVSKKHATLTPTEKLVALYQEKMLNWFIL